jgi:hypothetical protein
VPNPYGSAHRARRRQLAPMVEAGIVRCARCGELIRPGDFWDLGHIDGSGHRLYQGPECRSCNRATAKHKKERERRWSRQW